MYPDAAYYYRDDKESYCPRPEDGSFEACLKEKGKDTTDTESEEYEKCKSNFTKRHEKCRESIEWSQQVVKRHLIRTRPIKCDKFNYVYVLNLNESNFGKPYKNCDRPFYVQRIANSNLILLITKSDCEKTENVFYDKPSDVKISDKSTFCQKLKTPLHRRYSRVCLTHHWNVSFIFYCH